jgi:hypothetical protein
MEVLFSAKFDGVDRGRGRATTALTQVQSPLRKTISDIANQPGEIRRKCGVTYKTYWYSESVRPTIRQNMIHEVLD